MRAVRGSGTAGLRGIPKCRLLSVAGEDRTIPVIRPLLAWRRATLRAIVADVGFVHDPSNDDPAFERVRVRAAMAAHDWLDAGQIARAASHVAEADAALEAMRDWLWSTRCATPECVDDPARETWIDMAALPRELRRRLARDAIEATRRANGITRPAFAADANIESLLDAVGAGKPATHGGVIVSRRGEMWRFREAPPRRSG